MDEEMALNPINSASYKHLMSVPRVEQPFPPPNRGADMYEELQLKEMEEDRKLSSRNILKIVYIESNKRLCMRWLFYMIR